MYYYDNPKGMYARSQVEEEEMSDGIQILSLRVQEEDLR